MTVDRLQKWRETFPDPSTSPARYTKILSIGCPHVITTADAEAGGWIRGFSRIVHLGVYGNTRDPTPLVPFHGLSPFLKSLRVYFVALTPSQVFNLTFSFPLLEDLALNIWATTHHSDGSDALSTAIQP